MDKKELFERIKADDVKFVSLQFTDVTGSVKSVDAPVDRLEDALDDGLWFDGSSVEGFTRIQESDMLLIPDIETYAVLPWTPAELKRGRLFCDIFFPDGTPFDGDPRGALRRDLEALKNGAGHITWVPSLSSSSSGATGMAAKRSNPYLMMWADILISHPMMRQSG